jgi:predicted PurR-regulated permease PerM
VVLSVITGLVGTWSVRWAIYQLVMPLVSIVIASYVVNELAEKFNSVKNLNNAFKLVVFASTPSLLAAIIANLSLLLSWVGLFGLYSIYLFWIGISEMMETPDDKRLTYVLVAALVLIVIQFLLSLFIAPQMISPYM